jgi:hypothetical protein
MSRRQINFARAAASLALYRGYDRRSTVRQLTDAGWQILGRGGFATVLTHPDCESLVIKVSAKVSNRFTHCTDAFPRYARWLLENKIRSKFAPRIHFVRAKGDDRVAIVVMERCFRLRDSTFAWKAEETGDALSHGREPHKSAELTGWPRRFIDRLGFLGTYDLHSKNIMQRVDGTPVFTDPLIDY